MRSFAIGVDLGGTNLRIAAVEETGCQLELITGFTDLDRGRERVMADISSAIKRLIARFTPSHRLSGVGIGIPGVIDLERGTLCSASNLPGWSDYPVRRELERLLGTPVLLENDANCAALGEKWLGAGKRVENLCMLTLGTGVGGGFVFSGKPWHGATGMAGELGHMTVIPDGHPCGCGSRGCLEQYASAVAIRRMALEQLAKSGRRDLLALARNPEFGSQTVFEYAERGEAWAKNVFEIVGSTLGIALANLINGLNLPMYVIGGGVSAAWSSFSPAMFRELEKRSIVFRVSDPSSSQHKSTIVTRTELGGSAGLLGAARLPMLASRSRAFFSLAV